MKWFSHRKLGPKEDTAMEMKLQAVQGFPEAELFLSLSLSLSHTHTHTHTHARSAVRSRVSVLTVKDEEKLAKHLQKPALRLPDKNLNA